VKNWCCLEAPRKVEKLPSAQKLLDAKAQRLAQQKVHGMQSNMSTSSTRETCSPFSSPADTTNHQASAQAAVYTADSGSIEALTHATPQERLEFQFFCDQVKCALERYPPSMSTAVPSTDEDLYQEWIGLSPVRV